MSTILARLRRNNPTVFVAKARLFSLSLLSALLLFSQHVAVTHAIWHQAHGAPAHESIVEGRAHSDDEKHAGELCGFDTLLCQLLAGGAVASGACIPVADGTQALSAAAPYLAALTLIQPRSRGPPADL